MSLFRFDSPQCVADWSPVDDAVMGGVSQSGLTYDPEARCALFAGIVSRENGGGFASVRTRVLSLSVQGASAYVLEVRGDGRRYKVAARLAPAFDAINYQSAFDPPPRVWSRVRLHFADFRPTFRGRIVPGAPRFDAAEVCRFGLIVADGQTGSFALGIKSITAE